MKLLNIAKKYGAKVVAAGSLLAGSLAHAAIPAAISTAFTDLQADATSLEGYVWPVIIFVTFALIVIKLFKRFSNKV